MGSLPPATPRPASPFAAVIEVANAEAEAREARAEARIEAAPTLVVESGKRNVSEYGETAKRALRRYRNNRAITMGEEIAVYAAFLASGKKADEWKQWLRSAASPAIDAEVERIVSLHDQLVDFIRRAERKLLG